MSLLKVVNMPAEEREERRELDESCYRRVHTALGKGLTRQQALDRVARQLNVAREDVVAGYWRHVRREGLSA